MAVRHHSPTRALVEAKGRPSHEFSYSDIDDVVEKFLRIQGIELETNIVRDNLISPTQNMFDEMWWEDFGKDLALAYGHNVFQSFWKCHSYTLEEQRGLNKDDYKNELIPYFTNAMLEKIGTRRRVDADDFTRSFDL